MITRTRGFFIYWFPEKVLKARSLDSLCLLLMIFVLASCSNSPHLPRQEAERSLKVLNNDLAGLFTRMEDSDAYAAVGFVWGQPTAPVPFKKERNRRWPEDTLFSMATHSGHYFWDTASSAFIKKYSSDSILLDFPSFSDPSKNIRMVIARFETEQHLSRPPFPVRMSMEMHREGEEIMKLEQEGRLRDNLPSSLQIDFEAGPLKLQYTFSTERNGDRGSVRNELEVRAGPKVIAEGTVSASVVYTMQSYYFETIEPDLRIFDMTASGILNYKDIDPTSNDYVSSFNENCRIGFYDHGSGAMVGMLQMGEILDGEMFDYFIRFNDGSTAPAGEYLFVLDKLLNYKYQ